MRQFFATLFLVAAIGIAVWFSAILFVILAVLGAAVAVLMLVRRVLIERGILNPTPGVAPPSAESMTVIDAEFTRVDTGESVTRDERTLR